MDSKFETKLIHAGLLETRYGHAVTMPIFQSSTYEYEKETGYHDIRYSRLSNTPNHLSLHKKIAALEGSEAAIVTASGMAAISTTFLSLLSPGDHFLIQNQVYGGTHNLITEDFKKLGFEFDFIDPQAPNSWKEKLKPKTKFIYVESISNPLTVVPDLAAVVEFARKNSIHSLIDNTFASPFNFQACKNGFDLSLHSATKYLNGHSDVIAGAVAGKAKLIEPILHKLNHLGGSLDPHACFLLDRGLKTLAVRMKHQNESALKVAQFLSEQKEVSAVYYPGLETSSSYPFAKKHFAGFGGMMSFRMKSGAEAAKQCTLSTKWFVHAPSLGGVESLITLPASSSHSGMSDAELEKLGLGRDLIRLSIGIENTQDLIEDLAHTLS